MHGIRVLERIRGGLVSFECPILVSLLHVPFESVNFFMLLKLTSDDKGDLSPLLKF